MHRLDAMATFSFNAESLRALKEGTNELLDVFIDIMANKPKEEQYMHRDIQRKLRAIENEKWQSIRNTYLLDDVHGYNKGNFTEEEKLSPSKLLMDLTKTLDDMKNSVCAKHEEFYKTDERLRNEILGFKDQMVNLQKELNEVRWMSKKDKAALNTVYSNMEHIESVSKEKTSKIEQLQRENTVQLWESEKEKFLKNAKLRIDELEEDNVRLTKERDAGKRKLADVENQLRIEKMRRDMKGGGSKNETELDAELQKCKQHCFMLEKDMRHIECEFHNNQKYALGIFKGINEDYMALFGSVMQEDDPSPPGPVTLTGMRQLQKLLNQVQLAAMDGKLGVIRADLPDHYVATEADLKKVPIRKLSTAYKARLSPNMDRRLNSAGQTNGYHSSARRRKPVKIPGHPEITFSVDEEHPVLVDLKTGYIDMIKVMKYYPYMTKDFIEQHWKQFQNFDTNGDQTLDMTEMMSALTSTIGHHFTPGQVREAMDEVDVDGSDSIDFFEYICVANMLMHRTGRSDVFKSKLIQKDARSISRTCAVM